MSAKKTTGDKQREVDPASLALVLGQTRDLLRYHHALGLDSYPATPTLQQAFLGLHKCDSVQPPVQRPLPSATVGREKESSSAPFSAEQARTQLRRIATSLATCQRCTGQVMAADMGRGPVAPRLFVVGDFCEGKGDEQTIWGPEEDALFWKMMAAIGLDQESVYVTNCVKCPCLSESRETAAEHCFSFLEQELAAIQPSLICAMGAMAARQLLGLQQPLVRIRGRFHSYRHAHGPSARVMVTFHPRFLLEEPDFKAASWQDLQTIQRYL